MQHAKETERNTQKRTNANGECKDCKTHNAETQNAKREHEERGTQKTRSAECETGTRETQERRNAGTQKTHNAKNTGRGNAERGTQPYGIINAWWPAPIIEKTGEETDAFLGKLISSLTRF